MVAAGSTGQRASVPSRPAARPPAGGGGFDPGIFDELSDADLQPVKPVSRPGTTSNPYQTPASSGEDAGDQPYAGELATLGQRFTGAFVDNLLYNIAAWIAGFSSVLFEPPGEQEISSTMLIAWIVLAVTIFLIPIVINAVMITKSGQSIGKKAAGTRIVLDPSRELPGFVKGVLVRSYVMGLLSIIPLVGLIDTVMIFGQERKCLHDKMAGTIVVTAK